MNLFSIPTSTTPALPTEINLQILGHPSRWVLNTTASLDSPHVSPGSGTERVILGTSPLSCPASHDRKVEFIFRSRDQGWSSYPEDHGSYRDSWTWFEAGLRRYVRSEPSNPGVAIGRTTNTKISLTISNRHASEQFENYRIEIDREHQLMKDLRDGDEVVLWACDRFSGWRNHVEEATIKIWTLDELFNNVHH